MFISGHFHVLDMRKTCKYISCVAIGKFKRQVCKVSQQLSNDKDRPMRSLYCLFTPHIWMLLFAYIPFVVNCTFNATPTERLQQDSPPVFNEPHRSHVLFCEDCIWHHLCILVTTPLCCDWKSQAAIEITRRAHSISVCLRHIYVDVVLHAHPSW